MPNFLKRTFYKYAELCPPYIYRIKHIVAKPRLDLRGPWAPQNFWKKFSTYIYFLSFKIFPNLNMCFSFCVHKFLLKWLLFLPWLCGVFGSVGIGEERGRRLGALIQFFIGLRSCSRSSRMRIRGSLGWLLALRIFVGSHPPMACIKSILTEHCLRIRLVKASGWSLGTRRGRL